MKRAMVRRRVAGKVDFEKIGVVEPNAKWRVLQNEKGVRIRIYGQAVTTIGPWYGYMREDLQHAPCTHCGRTGVFGFTIKSHWCNGKDHAGNKLPCENPHGCHAEPSMSWHGVKRWEVIGNAFGREGWREVT